jgi:hypothetical protein
MKMTSIRFWTPEKPFSIIHSDETNLDEIQIPAAATRVEFRHYSFKDSEKKVITFPDTILELYLQL